MITAHVTVFDGDREIGKMYPARWFFRKHEEEPTTEVAIRRTVTEDLYLVMPAYQLSDQSAQMEVVINPLVNWIWLGFGLMALGTGLTLLPERTFAFAMARFPAEAATAGMLLLALSVTSPALAQHTTTSTSVPVVARSPVEKELQEAIICMCGTCGRQSLSECTCGTAEGMRAEISGLVKEGKTKDEVIQYYIAKYGSQEPLAAPIDRGFNRLAWLFPYAIGSIGAIAGAFMVLKWSRKPAAPLPAAPAAADDPALQARIDAELEDLD
jgi:cytochrome c-type biogenesis protein CcmH/NrfF